jgi:hypothetical protein
MFDANYLCEFEGYNRIVLAMVDEHLAIFGEMFLNLFQSIEVNNEPS